MLETNLFMWLEQLDEGAPQRWIELEKLVRLEGEHRDVEFQMRTKDGGVKHLSVNASFLERVADEEMGVIISIWHDITERVRSEEFTVILTETESKGALKVAERIRGVFETERFSPGLEQTVHMTVSIGVTQYQPEEELAAFVQRADKAMYLAKKQGKNRVIFSDTA